MSCFVVDGKTESAKDGGQADSFVDLLNEDGGQSAGGTNPGVLEAPPGMSSKATDGMAASMARPVRAMDGGDGDRDGAGALPARSDGSGKPTGCDMRNLQMDQQRKMMVKIGDVNYDYPGQSWQQRANPVQNIRKRNCPSIGRELQPDSK